MLFQKYIRGKSRNILQGIASSSQKSLFQHRHTSSGSFSTIAYSQLKNKQLSLYDNFSQTHITANHNVVQSKISLRKFSKLQKVKRKFQIDNNHLQLLRDNCKNNFKELYITEDANASRKCKKVKYSSTDKIEFQYIAPNNNDDDNFKHHSHSSDFSKHLLPSNLTDVTISKNSKELYIPRLTMHINSILSHAKPNPKEFASTCQKISKAKKNMEQQKARVVQLQEEFRNQHEKVDDTVFNLKQNHELLCKSFDPTFTKFIRFLQNEYVKEHSSLDNLQLDRHRHFWEIKKLLTGIERLQGIIGRLIQFRKLLICIKEKITQLPFYLEIEMRDMSHESTDCNIVASFNIVKHGIVSLGKKKLKLGTPALKENAIHQNEGGMYKKYLDPSYQIFTSPENLMDTLDAYEKENLMFITIYNQKKEDLEQLKKEKELIIADTTTSLEYFGKKLKFRKEELKEAKIKFQNLVEKINPELRNKYQAYMANFNNSNDQITRSRYTKSQSESINTNDFSVLLYKNLSFSNLSSTFSTGKFGNVFTKISNIIYNLLQNNPNLFEYLNEDQNGITTEKLDRIISKKINNAKTEWILSTSVQLLKILEKVMNDICSKYQQYKKSPELMQSLALIENKIIVEGKINKARLHRKFLEEKKEEMKREIYSKSTKLYVLPKRKIVEKYNVKPVNKREGNRSCESANIDGRELQDMLACSEDDSSRVEDKKNK